MESPRGNCLLIGVGGSGKQSLARLAAFISNLEVAQIQLRKGYGIVDLKVTFSFTFELLENETWQYKCHNFFFTQMELSNLYLKAGLKNVGIVFLLTDAQVPDESFLVLINDMLASGEITDLFPEDEVENIISSVRNEVIDQTGKNTRDYQILLQRKSAYLPIFFFYIYKT